jgi:hypothetical protein
MSMRRSAGFSWLLVAMFGLGCSSGSSPEVAVDVGEAQPGTEQTPQGDGFMVGEDLPNADGAADEQQPACLGETRQAEVVGLDIYVMLDISASMLEALPQSTITKWDAVRSALSAFVQDPGSADIGVGLQYFPLINDGVPFACLDNDDCGIGGPCSSAFCVADFVEEDPAGQLPALSYIGPASNDTCSSDAECLGPGESCRSMLGTCVVSGVGVPQLDVLPLCNNGAECAGLPGTVCEEIGACELLVNGAPALCVPSLGCPQGAGACLPFPYACLGQTVCDTASYAAPAVPIGVGTARGDIVTSLEAQVPNGLTPTGPALGGALEHARTWATQNPGRQVVTVLATDGLPTECTPVDIPEISQLAGDAFAQQNPVRTFVIGVFSAVDLGADGQERLDALASAGGSEQAFVINTADDVGAEFLNALNEIRDSAVSCDFQLDAQDLNFDLVNLSVSNASGTATDLVNVGDASACGADQGWYYVRNGTGTPTQITVCPTTCEGFRAGGITAELEVGCLTRIR